MGWLRKQYVDVVKALKEGDEEVRRQTQYDKISKGKYNETYKHIKKEILT